MAGCGDAGLDDPDTLDETIAEAIDYTAIVKRSVGEEKEGEEGELQTEEQEEEREEKGFGGGDGGGSLPTASGVSYGKPECQPEREPEREPTQASPSPPG